MQLILRVASGPDAGNNVTLRAGQVLQVGRTEWADFSVADDSEMAPVHFAVECGYGGCRVRDLETEPGTLVNGQRVTEGPLRDGDQIQAGRTKFAVTIEGVLSSAAAGGGGDEESAPPPPRFVKVGAKSPAEIAALFDLRDEARPLLDEERTPAEFVDLLATNGWFTDAILFLAYALPKREVIWWGSRCLSMNAGGELPPPDARALEAAIEWVKAPNEENRRAAEAAAIAIKNRSAASHLAWAVFYSGGSLTPPGTPEAPPAEGMTAVSAAVAITQAARSPDFDELTRRLQAFVQQGCSIADGEEGWE